MAMTSFVLPSPSLYLTPSSSPNRLAATTTTTISSFSLSPSPASLALIPCRLRNAPFLASVFSPQLFSDSSPHDDAVPDISPPGSSLFIGFGGDSQTPSDDSQQQSHRVECPPGLTHYETMAVLRPDITEDQRLSLTQRYEEAIIATGGMGVEVFNRGMMPLAYNIKTKNMGGISNRYLDGIYFLFTYFTKPESQLALQTKFNVDDDIIRSSTFKIKPTRG